MQCSVFIAMSLDGFIARPDGSLDWLSVVQGSGDDYGYAAFMSTVDTLVMGRATYDTVLGFGAWPYSGKRVIVMTRRPLTSRHGEETFAGTPQELFASLRGQRTYIDGGNVIRQFLAAGLVDDLTISVIPVLLGAGIPLFGAVADTLALSGVEHWPTGLVQLRYQTKSRR